MRVYANDRYEVVQTNVNGMYRYLVKRIGQTGIEGAFYDFDYAVDLADWYWAMGF